MNFKISKKKKSANFRNKNAIVFVSFCFDLWYAIFLCLLGSTKRCLFFKFKTKIGYIYNFGDNKKKTQPKKKNKQNETK